MSRVYWCFTAERTLPWGPARHHGHRTVALARCFAIHALEPIPQKIWWLICRQSPRPYGFFMLAHLSRELLRYAY